MIQCKECGKDISDQAPYCIGCGAPVSTTTRLWDVNGDGKIDFEDFKAIFGKMKDLVAVGVDKDMDTGKETISPGDLELFKQDELLDITAIRTKVCVSCGIEKPLPDFLHKHIYETRCIECRLKKVTTVSKSMLQRNQFKAALESTIDLKLAELMKSKAATDLYLSYLDAKILTASIRNIFKSALTFTPPQIEAACQLSEAVLAPSLQEKQNLIKAAIAIAGGSTGIAMVIGAVGVALGWGASLVASVTAVFIGHSMLGPLAWGVAGITLAALAGYFATTSNKQTDTERFLRVLKSGLNRAVDAIWDQHGEDLSKAITGNNAPN